MVRDLVGSWGSIRGSSGRLWRGGGGGCLEALELIFSIAFVDSLLH